MLSLTSLSIDISRIKKNLEGITSELSPSSSIMLVVKADAYGLGARKLIPLLQDSPVSSFAVAHLREAIFLREAGETRPILIFSQVLEENIPLLYEHKLTTLAYSEDYINRLGAYSNGVEKELPVHLKLNLGMNRIGCPPDELLFPVALIRKFPYLKLDGIMSHFSHANDPQELSVTKDQLQAFLDCKKDLQNLGLSPSYHIANSAATKTLRESHLDFVRVGLGAYENAISFHSHIIHCHHIPEGASVSYLGKYRCSKPSTIAVIGAGYADGIPSILSSRGKVLIKGELFPIAGQVCMDMLMIDLGDNHLNCSPGDKVTFFGENHGQTLSLSDFSESCGKNPREVLCGIGNRVTRHYQSD